MDLTSQRKLIRKLFVLLTIEGKNILIKRSSHSEWQVYYRCVSREAASKKCDELVRLNANMIKL